MAHPAKDEEREERIHMEIIVDAYGPEEQALGGYAPPLTSSFSPTWPKSSRVEWRRSSELSVIFLLFHPQPPLLSGIRRKYHGRTDRAYPSAL